MRCIDTLEHQAADSSLATLRVMETQMWPDRRLTDFIGIEHPIIQAPMAGPSPVDECAHAARHIFSRGVQEPDRAVEVSCRGLVSGEAIMPAQRKLV